MQPLSRRCPYCAATLVSFGFPTCEAGRSELSWSTAGPATSGYLIVTEDTSLHAIATRFELTIEGEVVYRNFGEKAGLTTLTCTDTFEDPEGTAVFTLTAAIVPPR